MTKIVVVGAGIGGIPAAYELRDLLGRHADITVISDHPYFQFVPSNPWVAVN
jgi:sulfide:quinone oxidoreductase